MSVFESASSTNTQIMQNMIVKIKFAMQNIYKFITRMLGADVYRSFFIKKKYKIPKKLFDIQNINNEIILIKLMNYMEPIKKACIRNAQNIIMSGLLAFPTHMLSKTINKSVSSKYALYGAIGFAVYNLYGVLCHSCTMINISQTKKVIEQKLNKTYNQIKIDHHYTSINLLVKNKLNELIENDIMQWNLIEHYNTYDTTSFVVYNNYYLNVFFVFNDLEIANNFFKCINNKLPVSYIILLSQDINEIYNIKTAYLNTIYFNKL